MPSKIENLKNECKTIEDNARHTAEAHYISAAGSKRMAFWLEVVPAAVASLSGILVVGQAVPLWWGYATVISAVIVATSSVISPHRSYYENLNAAKAFTVVKNKAKSLHSTFSETYSETEFEKEVRGLSEYYNQLVLMTPPTQEKAYKKAEKKLAQK